jgi:hypothetical protein
MGIIAGVKVGYRLVLLRTLLAIFDQRDGTYFLQSSEVVVSSPEFFNNLLLEWMEDACDKKSDKNDPERRRLSF